MEINLPFQPIAAPMEMIAQLFRIQPVSLIIAKLLSVQLLDSVSMDRSVHKMEIALVSTLFITLACIFAPNMFKLVTRVFLWGDVKKKSIHRHQYH